MLLFTQIFYFIAFLSLFLNKPIYGLLTNCLNGAPCDCDPDVIDYWEDLEFTTTSELLTTTMFVETTEKLITTMGNTTTTGLPTTMKILETTQNEETTKTILTTESSTTPTTTESVVTTIKMLETTVKEEMTTESAVSTTTENLETTKSPTTPTQPETTEFASTTTLTTTESLPTTNITIPSTIQSTTIATALLTTAESTTLLTTENIETTTLEVTTTTQPTTVEPTTTSTSTIMPTTTMPCVPCAAGQSLVLYDKNILNSNQSINNVPAYRCDNCNQSTISEVCYNPRNISVIRVRCTDSTLFCVCASNQKACYTVTEKAPLYEADYLIYANSSYSFLALNTGASEISNGKKTYEFSPSMTFIPNDKTFLNAPFLSGNII
ncbi:unnamed protein product [Meloidogyne enterolobii]|uniref:Uncharacterized protein n=1 Tax=Meloidogyne enterolobii TaxID=390850 RepID=A0ACB0YBY5_MELEN